MNLLNASTSVIYTRFVASLILMGGEGKEEIRTRRLLCILVYGSDKCGIPRKSNFIFIERPVHRVITETIALTLE